jgi:putative ABC transport system permease protein
MKIFFISWRTFTRNVKRYRMLMFTSSIAVVLIISFLGLSNGILSGVTTKAKLFYTGDLTIQGFERNQKSIIGGRESVYAAVMESIPRNAIVVERSIHYGSKAKLFHSGRQVNQRRFLGVDWSQEKAVLADQDFGADFDFDKLDGDSILISSVTARLLRAEVGDSVTVSLETFRSHINTGQFIVAGIFDESSFFGFSAYLDRSRLNEIMREPVDRIHEIGIFLPESGNSAVLARRLQTNLSESLDVFPLFRSKSEKDQALRGNWDGRRYIVVPLEVQLSALTDLIAALNVVIGLIVIVFLAIIVIGISNTFSMIVVERIREIGTMRAVGLTRFHAVYLFLFEAVFLGVTSTLIGVLLGVLLLSVGSPAIDFRLIPYSELFLINNTLQWQVSPYWIALIFLVVTGSSIFGALRPAVRAARIQPVEALRQ